MYNTFPKAKKIIKLWWKKK